MKNYSKAKAQLKYKIWKCEFLEDYNRRSDIKKHTKLVIILILYAFLPLTLFTMWNLVVNEQLEIFFSHLITFLIFATKIR